MDTALRHWLFHFGREWVSETVQMAHDHFFWGSVAVLVGTFFLIGFISLVVWSIGTGTMTEPPATYPPMNWPSPYLMR